MRICLPLILALLSGCGVYAPLGPATPLVSQSHPLDLSATVTPVGPAATIAVAPLPHLTLLARGSFFSLHRDYEDFTGGYTGTGTGVNATFYGLHQQQAEAAAGWHTNTPDSLFFCALAGTGAATVYRSFSDKEEAIGIYRLSSIRYDTNVRQYRRQYQTVFIQAQLAVPLNRSRLRFGPVLRYTRIFNQQLEVQYARPAALPLTPPTLPSTYVELGCFLRSTATKRLSFHSQACLTAGVGGSGIDRKAVGNTLFMISAGIGWRL